MKKQINDLLLKMQNGENCIGETANQLLDLFSVSKRFNFPNFIAGVMVGITICIIIVELFF